MSDIITDYQKWKRQGEDLKVQAKQATVRELLSEEVQIAQEYRSDFGAVLKPPTPITAFRYKSLAKSNQKKTAAKQKSGTKSDRVPTAVPPGAKVNPKLTGLQKRLATTKKKLDEPKRPENQPGRLKTESARLRTSFVWPALPNRVRTVISVADSTTDIRP